MDLSADVRTALWYGWCTGRMPSVTDLYQAAGGYTVLIASDGRAYRVKVEQVELPEGYQS